MKYRNLTVLTSDLGLIFDIRRFSIHDGPGIRTTVFFKGCPLSCWWCHNPEGQSRAVELWWRENRCLRCNACLSSCPQGAISWQGERAATDETLCALCGNCVAACPAEARQLIGRQMTVAEVMAAIEKDLPFYDESGGGVTFSGGEPLLQPHFLLELLQACKAKELHTALDTCGFAAWEALEAVRPYVDVFLYDVKVMDDQAHQKYTGVSNRLILRNLRRLAEGGCRLALRVPLIPGVNDSPQELRQLGEFAASLPGMPPIDLLPYHQTALGKYERLRVEYLLPDVHPPSPQALDSAAGILREYGLQVRIAGQAAEVPRQKILP